MPDGSVIDTVNLTYVESVNAALRRSLETDPTVVFFGEDVGKPGGVFGASKSLTRDFGDRVFDTPISESAILGAAVGSSIMGLRPVVEIMWVDFALVALDQIINQAANVRYVSNGTMSAPLTIRTQQGALPGSCAQHSQSLEAIFAHIPGVRVCIPATNQDAHDLLLASVFCDDPVVVIEHRELYFGPKSSVELGGPVPVIGGAATRRSGAHATAVTWGAALHVVLDAAEELAATGIDVEVIDARWLAPFDWASVEASVARTARCAVVHQANTTGGFGAEVAAGVMERCFFSLDAPVLRIGAPDLRMPAAPSLQAAVVPDRQRVVAELRRLVEEQ